MKRALKDFFRTNFIKALLVAGLSGLIIAAASVSALAQKKYDTGVTDTEIKIGNIMPYQRAGVGLWHHRQDHERLFPDDQRQWRRQRPQDQLHLL